MKINQNEINDLCIKSLKKFYIQYWLNRETGFPGKLVSHGNLFFRETDFPGKLVSLENWFRREIDFEGKLVSQGICFRKENWLRRKTGFTVKLVLQWNCFRGFTGKLGENYFSFFILKLLLIYFYYTCYCHCNLVFFQKSIQIAVI